MDMTECDFNINAEYMYIAHALLHMYMYMYIKSTYLCNMKATKR